MEFLLEEEELVCKYFNPTKELYDLEYIRLAKTFLNAYLRQRSIKVKEGDALWATSELYKNL